MKEGWVWTIQMTHELCWNIIICLKREVTFEKKFEKYFQVTAEKNLYKNNNAFIIISIIGMSEKFYF